MYLKIISELIKVNCVILNLLIIYTYHYYNIISSISILISRDNLISLR